MKTIITTDSGMDPIDKTYMARGIITNDLEEILDEGPTTSKLILQNKDIIYKTAAPSIPEYERIYTKALENGDYVIHLSMGTGVSSTSVATSNMVANELDPTHISVIDSKNGATGGTLLNLYVNHLANEGLSTKEILERIKVLLPRIKSEFFVPDPAGFIRSGRNANSIMKLAASAALRISKTKVSVTFDEFGNLSPDNIMPKTACNTKNLIDKWLSKLINTTDYDNELVVIGTLSEDKVNMNEVQAYLSNYFKTVIRQDINGVVAPYGSPDLIGVSLIRRK